MSFINAEVNETTSVFVTIGLRKWKRCVISLYYNLPVDLDHHSWTNYEKLVMYSSDTMSHLLVEHKN